MKKIKKYKKWFLGNKFLLGVLVIFLFEIYLRFNQLDQSPFGYDQVDNAWAAKNIVVNHAFPLVGMVAKGNSGIYIGPFYYYLISIVYWFTNLNPIASGIFAGLTSIFSFATIYFVFKKLFSKEVALIGIFINTFTIPSIIFDRVQWPVNLIPAVSLLIFYVLFRITQGESKKIITLAFLVGFSFSIHFTSIFYPLIIFLTLPFFPRNKETLKYILISVPLFLLMLLPNIIYQIQQKSANSDFASYISTYYHGFHLKRVIQLAGDSLIQFNAYFINDKLAFLKFIILPAFFLKFLYKAKTKKNLIFCYLVLIWFVIPWFIFTMYSGEISDYYFSINRFIALMIVSYLFSRLFQIRNIFIRGFAFAILIYLAVINTLSIFPYKDIGLKQKEENVKVSISHNQVVGFRQGVPESYLYYYLMRQKGINVY